MTAVVQQAPETDPSAHPGPRSLTLPIAGVLVVSAVLSIVTIGRNSFSLDETVSVTLARASWHDFAHTIVRREPNMSFYYLLLRGWSDLGRSEAVVRSFSLLVGLGAVAATMLLARQLFDRRTAVICGVLLAIDPLIVVFAQDARGYALSLLLVTLSSALFARAVTTPATWWTWAGYAVVSALAAYTNFWSALVLLGHAAALAFLPPHTAPWRRLIPTAIGLAVLLVPLALIIHTAFSGGVNWAAGSSAGKLFTKVRADVPHPVIDAAVVLLVAAVIGAGAVVRRHPRTTVVVEQWPAMFCLCWCVVPVAAVVALSLVDQPVLVLRYLGVCFPPFVMLVAYGLSRLRPVPLFRLALAGLVVVSGAGLAIWYRHGPLEDFRGAVDSVATRAQPGDGFVIFAPYNRVAVQWYMADHPVAESRLHRVFPAGAWSESGTRFDTSTPVTEQSIVRAVTGEHRVWLLLSAEQLYPTQEKAVLAGLRSAGLAPVGTRTFDGVQVVEYQGGG